MEFLMRPTLLAFLLLGLSSAAAIGQTSFPMITHVTPTAVQRGQTSEVRVECKSPSSLSGAYKLIFSSPDITAGVISDKKADAASTAAAKDKDTKAEAVPVVPSIAVKITPGSKAALGVHEFRVACAHGLSSLGMLVVVDAPVVLEKPGINLPAKAQPVPLPSVACGRIEVAENVDYFKIHCRAGQVVTLEVQGARLQDKIHDLQKHLDPFIAVLDMDGRELAASDDAYFADPTTSFKAPRDGDYLVLIRDAKFEGDPRWSYALSITDKPYVAQVYPMALNPGREALVEPVGSAKLLKPVWPITPPIRPGVYAIPLTYPGGETNPAPIVVTNLPLISEQEPNDEPAKANRIEIPCGVNGRIGEKRDLDHFVFKAVKGKKIRVEVFARRFGTELRSQLDSQLDILSSAGKVVASNDDVNGKDAAIEFSPTADGEYVVRIRDLNNKGGEGFVYYLEADWIRPSFSLKCDPSKAMMGPGSRAAWYPLLTRTNGFEGPVKIEVKGLPAGVSVNPLTIPANMTTGLLVVSAAPGSKLDASLVEIVGTAEAKDENGQAVTLTRNATPVEEIYLPGGGRGRFDVGMQAVGITTDSDLMEVQVKPNRVTLKPGEEVKIEVNLKRRKDYDKAVTLDVILRHLGIKYADPLPPGVTMVENKSKTLLGTASVGHIVLKAAADAAPCTDVPICVQGFVPINFVVKVGYSSEPIFITVKK